MFDTQKKTLNHFDFSNWPELGVVQINSISNARLLTRWIAVWVARWLCATAAPRPLCLFVPRVVCAKTRLRTNKQLSVVACLSQNWE